MAQLETMPSEAEGALSLVAVLQAQTPRSGAAHWSCVEGDRTLPSRSLTACDLVF